MADVMCNATMLGAHMMEAIVLAKVHAAQDGLEMDSVIVLATMHVVDMTMVIALQLDNPRHQLELPQFAPPRLH
jgi:hypothetical protein